LCEEPFGFASGVIGVREAPNSPKELLLSVGHGCFQPIEDRKRPCKSTVLNLSCPIHL
jgi:hypothetical protein